MLSMGEKAAEYSANFSICDGWEEKYQYIIDLGKALPPMPVDEMVPENQVQGCMSQVWLVSEYHGDCLTLRAQSDAVIVRGLIAIIQDLCDQQPLTDIRQFDFGQFFDCLGLSDQLSPNRRNGLVAFYQRVRQAANRNQIDGLATDDLSTAE